MKIQNKQKNRERKKNGDPWNQKIMGSYKYFSKIFIKKNPSFGKLNDWNHYDLS